MNKKILYVALLLHFFGAVASQKASINLKDKKKAQKVAIGKSGVSISNLLFTVCAASALGKATSAQDSRDNKYPTVVPLYDVSTPDCIPFAFYPNMLCMRSEDYNRNMTEALYSLGDVDNIQSDYVNQLGDNIQTQADWDYFFDLDTGAPNLLWTSQAGSQYRSISWRYNISGVSGDNSKPVSWNYGEYYLWFNSRNQTHPYQPHFKKGTLTYQPGPGQWQELVWTGEPTEPAATCSVEQLKRDKQKLSRNALARMNQNFKNQTKSKQSRAQKHSR